MLAAGLLYNVSVFGSYAQDQGDRFGFRVGQERDLATRMRQVSGNDMIDGVWYPHIRIGELVSSRTLLLPPEHPFETEEFRYFARIDVDELNGSTGPVDPVVLEALLTLDHELLYLESGEVVALITDPGDEPSEVVRALPVSATDGFDVDWVVATDEVLAEAGERLEP